MQIKVLSALLQCICIIGVTVSYDFPSSLTELCPYSSFCGHNKKTINVSQGLEPCCRSCSCDSDCGLKRNCCFYEDDHYRIEEKGETSCVAPINIEKSTNLQIGRYFMIDKCPGANDTCRIIKAARWGNLFPHLSYNTGVIYYNQFCARCHNELHVVPWALAVHCPPRVRADTKPLEIEKLLAGRNSYCFLYFQAPEGIDLSSEFCSSEIIQECKKLNPSTDIDTFQNLEEQCRRFNATFAPYSFQFRSVFRNVYCFLCSDGLIYKTTNITDLCISHNNEVGGRVNPGNLETILLSYVTDYSVTEDEGEKMVCDRIRKDVCRPLVCPEGQLSMNNKCHFPPIFVGDTCSVLIKLEPTNLEISKDMIGLLDRVKGHELLRHGLNEWTLEFFKVVNNASSIEIKYFVARLYKNTHEEYLEHILASVRQALDNIWQLKVGNVFVNLTPSFNDFITVSGSYNNTTYFSVLYQEEVKNYMFVEKMIILSEVHTIRSPSLIITKSYFCNQVDFFDGEYVYFEYHVYLKNVNITLGNGKFRRLQNSDGNYIIRVCYVDIGHEWMYKNSANIFIDWALSVFVPIGASLYVLNGFKLVA